MTIKSMLNQESINCPHCNASLVHSEIPQGSRFCYLPLETPDDGRFLFYSKVIGRSSIMHDRTLAYTCPSCDHTDVIPGCEAMWAELMGLDVLTFLNDGTPVIYTEEQRDRDKGRDWDTYEYQEAGTSLGKPDPEDVERLKFRDISGTVTAPIRERQTTTCSGAL